VLGKLGRLRLLLGALLSPAAVLAGGPLGQKMPQVFMLFRVVPLLRVKGWSLSPLQRLCPTPGIAWYKKLILSIRIIL